METLSFYCHLVRLQVRARMEYRANLVLGWFALAFGYASAYGAIWIIVTRFQMVGGWSWPEIALLLGFHVLGYSLGASFTFNQLRRLEELVRLGGFDTLLTRPMNSWAFLVFSGFNLEYGGHVMLGLAIILWALPRVDIAWSAILYIQIIASLISAAILTASIFTILAACSFIMNNSRYLFSLYFVFWEIARYPLTIFAWPMQIAMLTITPLGFMAYVPIGSLLGKSVPLLGRYAGVCGIAAGPTIAMIAALFWRFCLRRYQGSGSQ